MKPSSFKEVIDEALIENTAQNIFHYLEQIENEREIYAKRWIWELLQNALDATSPAKKVEIEIIVADDELVFRHDGLPFESKEIAHLICHGSTKKETDIGRFGTGFLTTHLLARRVQVRGVNSDKKEFEFMLDRSGKSANEIKSLMEDTIQQYERSIKPIGAELPYAVQYTYQLNDISMNTVKIGIREFNKSAPYLLAFNEKLGAIEINFQDSIKKFELIDEKNEGTFIRKIIKEKNGNIESLHELLVVKDHELEIAVKGVRDPNGIYQIDRLDGIPRIFLAFPLIDTQDLPFPVVVNSRYFKPTKEREGIFLGPQEQETDDIKQNKELLKNSISLFIRLISCLGPSELRNINVILELSSPPNKDWLDVEWYKNLLRECISELFKIKILKTEVGEFIAFEESLIPTIDKLEEELLLRLWDLCYCFDSYRGRMLPQQFANEWAKILVGWKSLGLDLEKNEITVEKVSFSVESYKNLQEFKANLSRENELDILNKFYNLLLDLDKRKIFDEKNILPDQNGNLRRAPDLFKDDDVDEVLKNISQELGIDVRNDLLDSGATEAVQSLLHTKKEEEVLSQVVTKVKQVKLAEEDQYIQANAKLFKWLIEKDKIEFLEGYPVISEKRDIFITLNKQAEEKPLAPKEIWDEVARTYSDIFPQDDIISSIYFEMIPERDKWDKIQNSSLILTNPLYEETEKLGEDDLIYLLCEPESIDKENEESQGHELIEEVKLSKIAFLEKKDKGIIDTVRKSKEKARKFIRFLFDYIVEYDSNLAVALEASCSCGSRHKIFPAYWLKVLRKREWIPVRKDKSEKPTAQYLAPLLERQEDLLKKCGQDKPSKLLSKIGISISDLMMKVAAKDGRTNLELDKAVASLLNTFMKEPAQLNKLAQLTEDAPDIFIKEMEEKIKTREQIRKNQSTGTLVENILKDILEKDGFVVERTGVGSDFIVEYDFVEDEVENIFEVKRGGKVYFYIEIKTTSQDFVKMTLTQAKEARNKADRYVLCVVKRDEEEITEVNVKNFVRFVLDIGDTIKDKVSKVEDFKFEQEEISEESDISIEINEGPIRFKINKRIWEAGKTFEQFLECCRS